MRSSLSGGEEKFSRSVYLFSLLESTIGLHVKRGVFVFNILYTFLQWRQADEHKTPESVCRLSGDGETSCAQTARDQGRPYTFTVGDGRKPIDPRHAPGTGPLRRTFRHVLCGGLVAASLLVTATPRALAAPAIYPVDTAKFLSGAYFDFKVEFDTVVKPGDVRVRINGNGVETMPGARPLSRTTPSSKCAACWRWVPMWTPPRGLSVSCACVTRPSIPCEVLCHPSLCSCTALPRSRLMEAVCATL